MVIFCVSLKSIWFFSFGGLLIIGIGCGRGSGWLVRCEIAFFY